VYVSQVNAFGSLLDICLVCLACSSSTTVPVTTYPAESTPAADDIVNTAPSAVDDMPSRAPTPTRPAADETANTAPLMVGDVTSRATASPAADGIAGTAPSSVQDASLPAFRVVHPGLQEAQAILAELSPRPKLKSVRPRTRKAESAAIITSSPYKQFVNDKMAASKPGSKRKCTSASQACKTKPQRTKRIKQETKKTKKESKKAQQETDETPCCICSRKYNDPPFEDWIACGKCGKWYHEACGPDDVAICYNCIA